MKAGSFQSIESTEFSLYRAPTAGLAALPPLVPVPLAVDRARAGIAVAPLLVPVLEGAWRAPELLPHRHREVGVGYHHFSRHVMLFCAGQNTRFN